MGCQCHLLLHLGIFRGNHYPVKDKYNQKSFVYILKNLLFGPSITLWVEYIFPKNTGMYTIKPQS